MARKTYKDPKAPIIAPMPLLCWTPGCAYTAMVRRRVGTNAAGGELWRNYCYQCDDKWHHERNRQWCIDNGLETVEKQKAFCKEGFRKGLVKREPAYTREPGSDDE